MRYLFKLNHPAHFHLFKNVITELQKLGHEVRIIIKNKDILANLLNSAAIEYCSLIKSREKSSKSKIIFNNLLELLYQDYKLYRYVIEYKPDAMIGTDINIAHIGWLLNIPSYILNEDDIKINKLFCYFTYPFATNIISPLNCDVGIFENKRIGYKGYQKLAYLHPDYFNPDISIVRKYISSDVRYFIIRLVSFEAGHDIESKSHGLNLKLIGKLITFLEKYGSVFISSEKKVKGVLETYLLDINPLDIHHLMAFSDIFISDSQSMTVEAAMLGIPSIRYNSFVGKISVLNELENYYNLSFGVNQDQEKLFNIITRILNMHNSRETFQKRKNKMLLEKKGPNEILLDQILKST